MASTTSQQYPKSEKNEKYLNSFRHPDFVSNGAWNRKKKGFSSKFPGGSYPWTAYKVRNFRVRLFQPPVPLPRSFLRLVTALALITLQEPRISASSKGWLTRKGFSFELYIRGIKSKTFSIPVKLNSLSVYLLKVSCAVRFGDSLSFYWNKSCYFDF